MRNRVELLAPAGNMESFQAAMRAGADAIYLAGQKFGARAFADNFSEEEIISCIHFAHFYGIKVYLTLNTLVKEKELDLICPFVEPLYLAGLDGVIIQDLGVLRLLRTSFPDLELHASTQMSIADTPGVTFLKQLGVCRVVPAREISLSEIAKIKQETGISLECFIHGAMCYSYSGQCLFSSVLGGRSGNRGRCAQPCRLPYGTHKNQEVYPLSLKDMCTLDILPDLLEAGIDSFKVEGRMKAPEYVAGVISIYRKYIDLYYSGKEYVVEPKDREVLLSLYIRSEVGDGYYYRRNSSQMPTLHAAGAYKQTSDTLKTNLRSAYLEKGCSKDLQKYFIHYSASFVQGEEAIITASVSLPGFDTLFATVTGSAPTEAIKQPVTVSDLCKGIRKLGDTCFVSDEQEDIYLQENSFYSLKEINMLRRELVASLEDQLTKQYGLVNHRSLDLFEETGLFSFAEDKKVCKEGQANQETQQLSVLVYDREQLREVLSIIKESENKGDFSNINRLYLEESLVLSSYEWIISQFESICSKPQVYIALSQIRRSRERKLFSEILSIYHTVKFFDGFLVRNLQDLMLLQSVREETGIILDQNLYVWNHFAYEEYLPYCDEFTDPYELRSVEVFGHFEKIVYGRIPMMVSANCLKSTFDGCVHGKTNTWFSVYDRKNMKFDTYIDCLHCHNIIFNSVPLAIRTNLTSMNCNKFRLAFTNEGPEETRAVISYYRQILRGENLFEFPIRDYTTGYEKHGVE